MKKQLAIGSAIAAICLYFAFRGLSIRETLETFRAANPRWILLAIAVYATGYLLRSLRWEILIDSLKRIPAAQLFAPLIIGFFANSILPFRMGELVRAHVTGSKFRLSRTASLGTIFLERLCDAISFLAVFMAAALFFPFPSPVKKGAASLGMACGAATLGLVLIVWRRQRFLTLIERWPLKPAWRAKIRDGVSHFAQGVSGMKQGRPVLRALALSLAIWTIEGTTLYLIARAFSVPLHYPQSFFLLFFIGLAVALPQAPGYVGTVEFFGVTALSLLGIPKEQGLPVILAIHGTQIGFILLLGLWALWHEGWSVGKIMAERKQ